MKTPEQKAKHAAYMRAYYAKSQKYRDYMRERGKELVASGKKKERCSKYYYDNHARIRAARNLERKLNPEKFRKVNDIYRAKNRQKIRDSQNAAYQANPEPRRKKVAEYRLNNLEKCRERSRTYHLRHPQKYRDTQAQRRARKANAKGQHKSTEWLAKLDYYGWKCYYCHIVLTPKSATQDHAIPIARGGTNWLANLLPCCKSCNCKKHDKTVFEYLEVIKAEVNLAA